MLYESFTLLRNRAADHECPNQSREELGTVEKLALVALSVVVAGGTMFLPVALLHLQ